MPAAQDLSRVMTESAFRHDTPATRKTDTYYTTVYIDMQEQIRKLRARNPSFAGGWLSATNPPCGMRAVRCFDGFIIAYGGWLVNSEYRGREKEKVTSPCQSLLSCIPYTRLIPEKIPMEKPEKSILKSEKNAIFVCAKMI